MRCSIVAVMLWSIGGTATAAAHGDCAPCHGETAPDASAVRLVTPLPTLCIDCHQERIAAGEHVIDVPPGVGGISLPLLDGMISCTTCHDPHGNQAG